ncbi:MAG: thiamine pyrophosphate-dependent enzyme [Bdellovibrionales bacterium]
MKPFEKDFYKGAQPSTLCVGCGHDQISKHLIQACFESQIDPVQLAKISGIGCSSKTPNYFLNRAQGFNTIHGRMASIATGVKVAHSQLKILGVSGDGDTGSIGLGSFLHTIKRNVPMIYLIENNGVYGLTKGQFSATALKETSTKSYKNNPFYPLDLCRLALEAGCGFVARSFSGDKKQLINLLKLALKYEGFALIDIVSPCVAYGNQEDFPYSFSSMKTNTIVLNELDFIEEGPKKEDTLRLPDGSLLEIKKRETKNYDPTNLKMASDILKDESEKNQIITGLIYYKEKETFLKQAKILKKPLVSLEEKEIRPSSDALKKIMNLFV